ncbi:DUF3429 domain-containing protein [Sneathiella aquimaris]|uniref:DUF3429 domain-containing protein n=1 Tax=Sneathiella aquimaris TaxID=2599305 RepID=UPI00146E8911|nr:DUF3429 domain-containing protein [Sneathiella aquimaris]
MKAMPLILSHHLRAPNLNHLRPCYVYSSSSNEIQMKQGCMKAFYPYLTLSGALPFIFCSLLLFAGVDTVPFFGNTEHVLKTYALIIASFLTGIHWGQHLSLTGKWSRYLPVLSNINIIVLWLLYLMLPFQALLFAFVLSFLTSLAIDRKLYQEALITPVYFKTRCSASVLVILSLIASGFFM